MITQMMAAVLYGKERLTVEPVAVPEIGPDDVLVEDGRPGSAHAFSG